MSLIGKLKYIRDLLLQVTTDTFHYRNPTDSEKKKLRKWIVWQEDSEANSLYADNKKQEQAIHGTIDLYTLDEYDELVDKIQQALYDSILSWRLNMVVYEDETNLIHYEWEFEIE